MITGRIFQFAAFVTLWGLTPLAAQEPDSAGAARQVTMLLEQRGLQAFAAEHIGVPGTFSAVLLIPGTQLLAITTTYPTPQRLRQLIAAGDHRQVYIDLQTAGAREGRVFVQDLKADGLRPDRERDSLFDVVSHDTVRDIAYDGDWQTQRLSKAEYEKAFASDEHRYAAALGIVAAALSDQGTPAAVAGRQP